MNRADHRVATLCRVLEVSPIGYYAWRQRAPSPRILYDLREEAHERVAQKRVVRLMREAGLRGVHRRRFMTTTERDERRRRASSGGSHVHCKAARRVLCSRYHLCADVGRISVPGRCHRRIQPPSGRLGNGQSHASQPGGGRAGDGPGTTQAARRDPPLGSRGAIYVVGLQ